MSLHSATGSLPFSPQPTNPSSISTYSLRLATITFLAEMTSNILISVFLSLPSPKRFFKSLK
jgi:hypothetical protein